MELKILLLNIRLLLVKIQNKIYDLSKGCDLILRREEKNERIKILLLNIRLLLVKIQNKIYDLSKGCNLI